MAHLVFYEKPGCVGNARQRALLESAGHTLTRRNLLDAPWTRARLLEFLQALPVALWFNMAAPRIKSGEIDPDRVDVEGALALLLAEPLLIRRPLMQRDDGACMAGFDTAEVERFVGLGPHAPAGSNVEGCARAATGDCPTPTR
jgi:nitrogenase-associated protein